MTDHAMPYDATESGEARTSTSPTRRQQSKIKFPYVGIDEVEILAEQMWHTYSGRCHINQLAAAMKQTPKSGAFRVKVTGAKLYGLVDDEPGPGNLALTPLGHAIVDPATARDARVQAFMNVPLFQAIYDEVTPAGGRLPGGSALEKMIERLGVVTNQTSTARQSFMRSAAHAGFFAHGDDRLVLPAVGPAPAEATSAPEPTQEEAPPSSTAALGSKPAIVVEVFKRLPDEGEPFSASDRSAWLTLLKASLDVLYPNSAPEPDDPNSLPNRLHPK